MLKVMNVDHFLKVVRETVELDEKHDHKFHLVPKLINGLKYLNTFADDECDGRNTVELYFDSAPLSFYVLVKKRGEEKHWMNGGFLFHSGAGFDDGTFAVELDPEVGPHWTLHS